MTPEKRKAWQDELDELEAQAGIFLAAPKDIIEKARKNPKIAPLFKKTDNNNKNPSTK